MSALGLSMSETERYGASAISQNTLEWHRLRSRRLTVATFQLQSTRDPTLPLPTPHSSSTW